MQDDTRAAKLGCLWAMLPIILLFTAAPILSVIISSSIADAAGCVLHEGFTNPCIVFGADMSGTLYAMFVAGWLSFVTLPIGLAALAAWIAFAIILWTRRKSAQPESGQDAS